MKNLLKNDSLLVLEKYASTAELCAMFRLHKNTVYRAVKRGALRGVKIGRDWRFSPSEILSWMRSETIAV